MTNGTDAAAILSEMLNAAEKSLEIARKSTYPTGHLKAAAIGMEQGRIYALREAISRIAAI